MTQAEAAAATGGVDRSGPASMIATVSARDCAGSRRTVAEPFETWCYCAATSLTMLSSAMRYSFAAALYVIEYAEGYEPVVATFVGTLTL